MVHKMKKVRIIVSLIFLALVIIYVAMLLSTNPLMAEVREVFSGDVSQSDTEGRAIHGYNINKRASSANLGDVELTVVRLFVLHNFNNGYIWAFYRYLAYDTEGELITGSWNIPTKWQIQRESGRWEIVKIFEEP